METLLNLLPIIIVPISALAGWLVAKKRRDNELVQNMNQTIKQFIETIDELSVRNKDLYKELTEARVQIHKMLDNQGKMQTEIEALHNENKGLKEQVFELAEKLKNVKTITRTK